jgi:hypothetical protein
MMVDCRAVYDKAVQENNKDLAQSIKDISVVRTLPTTAQRAAIGKWLAPHDDSPRYDPSGQVLHCNVL